MRPFRVTSERNTLHEPWRRVNDHVPRPNEARIANMVGQWTCTRRHEPRRRSPDSSTAGTARRSVSPGCSRRTRRRRAMPTGRMAGGGCAASRARRRATTHLVRAPRDYREPRGAASPPATVRLHTTGKASKRRNTGWAGWWPDDDRPTDCEHRRRTTRSRARSRARPGDGGDPDPARRRAIACSRRRASARPHAVDQRASCTQGARRSGRRSPERALAHVLRPHRPRHRLPRLRARPTAGAHVRDARRLLSGLPRLRRPDPRDDRAAARLPREPVRRRERAEPSSRRTGAGA